MLAKVSARPRTIACLLVALTIVITAGIAAATVPDAAASTSEGVMAVGTIDLTTSWTTVELDRSFDDPVVVMGPPSMSDDDPVVVRIRDVQSGSFQARLQEWDYDDGRHGAESVPYMVLEAGWQEIGGRTWYAGHVNQVNHDWKTVVLSRSYRGQQTVLGGIVTNNGGQAVSLRIDSIDESSFRIRLEEERGNDGWHAGERVDFIVAPCCVDTQKSLYRSGKASTDSTVDIQFPEMAHPRVFAAVSSLKGSDPVSLRTSYIGTGKAALAMQEEASNGESKHTTEEIRYLVMDFDSVTAPADSTTTLPPITTTTTTTTLVVTLSPTTTTQPLDPTTTSSTTAVVTLPPTTTTLPPPTTTTTVPTSETSSLDGSCYRPSNAVRVDPGDDIAAAARAHAEGTIFLLGAGVHSLADISPRAGQVFAGERGPNCERLATLSGAVTVTSWTASDGRWKSVGHDRSVEPRSVPCEPDYPRCHHPQDLYLNGRPLRHVASVSAVTTGTWHFDYGAKSLWVGDDPTNQRLQLSVKEAAFRPTASDVRIAGLHITHYANRPQFGVIGRHGTDSGWIIEDNDIGFSHSVAAVLGPNASFVGNVVRNQGGLGLKAIGSNVAVRDNVVSDSGWAGQLATWEGGGIKISADRATIARNCVADNRGPGLWGDEGARQVVFDANTVFGNYTQGIFYEISSGATVSNNRVGHNGRRFPWLYGAQIMISTSSDVDVFGNTVEVNGFYGNAITLVWQDRHMGSTLGNRVHHNDVTFLSSSGVAGMRSDWSGGDGIYTNNWFTDNAYHSEFHGNEHFKGVDGSMTLDQLKTNGQEIGSTMDRDVRTASWSCPEG